MLKQLTDLILALTGVIIASPVLVLTPLIILVADRQNPFFLQDRLGQSGTVFRIVKLRTMRGGKVTRIGHILRKTGIDEIPQLFNILQLQMSLVGPRPLTLQDVERLGWNTSYHLSRWDLKPGLTGLAQLSPSCHRKMSWFLDCKYIQCQSFFLDLKILTASSLIPFLGKKKVISWFHSKSSHERSR